MELIDTHQHLFYREALCYPWLADVRQLDDDFPVERYVAEAGSAKPTGTLFMECDVAEEDMAREARFIYSLAERAPVPMLGVIAAGRPEKEGFTEHLEAIDHPLLVGLRRILHRAPADTAESDYFIPNLKRLASRGLTFDLCVRADQLDLALGLVRAVPDLQFILDHCGSPHLDGSSDPAWTSGIRALAAEPNIACKVSGLTSYGTREQVKSGNLYRSMNTVFEAFGEDRIVWGGDWPVCTLNSSFASWIETTLDWASDLKLSVREKLFGLNAREIYGLDG